MPRRGSGRTVAAAAVVLALGCVGSDRDRDWVARALSERGMESAGDEDPVALLEGGLDEREAVALALSNSPAYQAELARIDSARADLDEAGRIANPQITLVGALGPISAVATLLAPLESLWQLPQRTEAASRQLEAVAEALVQTGLDLARDARLAHVERVLAGDRIRLREELAATWAELARIAEVRSRLGEASPAEAAAVGAEAHVANDALETARTDAALSDARLRVVLGLEPDAPPADAVFVATPPSPPELGDLIAVARASRPDVRAAELAIQAAAARAGWERSRVVLLAAQVEGHWTQAGQPAMRLGGRIELPIFSANQGGIGRAEAELARAQALLVATRQRVVAEIVQARARVTQAQSSLETYRAEVVPALEEALRVATRTYELGEESYVVVLDVLRRMGDARLREAELVAETRRADAELERAVGARLEGSTP